MLLNFDDLINRRLGGFGRWQLLFSCTIMSIAFLPLEYYPQLAFLTPHHHCRQPNLDNLSWTHADIVNLSIPFKSDPETPPGIGQAHYPCREFVLDGLWQYLTPNSTLEEARNLRYSLFSNATTRSCKYGVSFDSSTAEINGGLVEDFDIVCDRSSFIVISTSAYVFGMLIGALLSGPLTDRFGRRKICLIMPVAYLLCGLSTALVQDMWTFTVLRFLTAVAISLSFVTIVILVTEWTTKEQRNSFTFIGKVYLGIVARGFLILCIYSMPSWRSAYCLYFIVCLPAIPGCWFWYESPRWLLSRGRVEEAHAVLLKVMKWNRKVDITVDEQKALMEELTQMMPGNNNADNNNTDGKKSKRNKKPKSTGIKGNLLQIWRVARIRRRLLLFIVIWPLLVIPYYGLNLNAVRLDTNPFGVAFFQGVVGIPGCLIQYLSFRFFDRKKPFTFLCAVTSSAILSAFTLILLGYRGLTVASIVTGAVMVSEAIVTMLYIRTPEVFPTSVRTTCLGLSTCSARIGMIIGSFVERLDESVWVPLPMLVFFLSSIFGTILTGFLPRGKGEMEEWSVHANKLEMKEVGIVTDNEDLD